MQTGIEYFGTLEEGLGFIWDFAREKELSVTLVNSSENPVVKRVTPENLGAEDLRAMNSPLIYMGLTSPIMTEPHGVKFLRANPDFLNFQFFTRDNPPPVVMTWVGIVTEDEEYIRLGKSVVSRLRRRMNKGLWYKQRTDGYVIFDKSCYYTPGLREFLEGGGVMFYLAGNQYTLHEPEAGIQEPERPGSGG